MKTYFRPKIEDLVSSRYKRLRQLLNTRSDVLAAESEQPKWEVMCQLAKLREQRLALKEEIYRARLCEDNCRTKLTRAVAPK